MEIPFQNRASCREPQKIEGKRVNTKRDLKKWAHMCALALKAVNTALPSSKIKKKYLACSIMRVGEAVAAGFVHFGHFRPELNIADIATKVRSRPRRELGRTFLIFLTSNARLISSVNFSATRS